MPVFRQQNQTLNIFFGMS